MIRKVQIDKTVASLVDVPQKVVTKVTREFLEQVMVAIVEDGELTLEGFGQFRLKVKRGYRAPTLKRAINRKIVGSVETPHDEQRVVLFKKAQPFNRKIRQKLGKASEVLMEKYAVDEHVDQEELEKKASEGCPECGRKPEKHGQVLMCPVHGTQPWEDAK